MKTKIATQRLIDSVWTMEYEEHEGGIFIKRYDRDNQIGYLEEEHLPRLRMDESPDRTVVGVWISPYKHLQNAAVRHDNNYHKVLNKKNIFCYNN